MALANATITLSSHDNSFVPSKVVGDKDGLSGIVKLHKSINDVSNQSLSKISSPKASFRVSKKVNPRNKKLKLIQKIMEGTHLEVGEVEVN